MPARGRINPPGNSPVPSSIHLHLPPFLRRLLSPPSSLLPSAPFSFVPPRHRRRRHLCSVSLPSHLGERDSHLYVTCTLKRPTFVARYVPSGPVRIYPSRTHQDHRPGPRSRRPSPRPLNRYFIRFLFYPLSRPFLTAVEPAGPSARLRRRCVVARPIWK